MKKIKLLLIVFSLFTAYLHSSEGDFVLAASFQRFGESGSINNIHITGGLSELGLYSGFDFYKNSESKIGFYFGSVIYFPVASSFIANYQNDGKKDFAISLNSLIGPSFRLINNENFRMQLAPIANIGFEIEKGQLYKIDYFYKGFLLGFGANLDMSLVSSKEKTLGWGTSLSVQPFYKPFLDTSEQDQDIKFDSYARVIFNIYLGIHFHGSM